VATETVSEEALLAPASPDAGEFGVTPLSYGRATSPQLSVIFPVYNPGPRFADNVAAVLEYLDTLPGDAELIVVDDGSPVPAAPMVRAAVGGRPNVTVIRYATNRGKGYAVRRGMEAAVGRYQVFLDSDLAYLPDQIGVILKSLERGADVAVACRVLPESSYTMSPAFFHYLYTRHLSSRAFNAIVRWTLLPGMLDTQAGLKGFSRRAAATIFPRLSVDRFGFDVEALVVAQQHGYAVEQCAVTFRYDDEPTTVRFVRDISRMLRDLWRIYGNVVRRQYD
jgi:dolichyl-phosphate beta-glucosyltransferase